MTKTELSNLLENDYKGHLVKVIDTKGNVVFYGTFKNADSEYLTLFPYLSFEVSENGESYPKLIGEGRPMRVRRDCATAIHPISGDEFPRIISSHKKHADIVADRVRLEELATKIDLAQKEEAYKKLQRKDKDENDR